MTRLGPMALAAQLAVLLGCTAGSKLPTSARSEAPTLDGSVGAGAAQGVRWYGALHAIMHEGRTTSAVELSAVVPGPHVWGLGALEGLHGEVTVLDDEVWLARPRADGTAAVTRADLAGADRAQGAALLVVANVATWEEVPVAKDVPWEQLESFLEAQLVAHGTSDAPRALRIEGPVAGLRWHVVDGSKLAPGAGHAQHARSSVRGVIDLAQARLIGFFSSQHQGVFTHAGARTHFHVLVPSLLVSGHVDEVSLRAGARLLIEKE